MTPDRDPNHLCEDLRIIYHDWLVECGKVDLSVKAIVTWRSAPDQALAKQQGLSNAGPGESPHNCVDANGNPNSYAFDFACYDLTGKYIKDGADHRYAQAAEIGKKLGLEWGGDWTTFKDFDHLELPGWRNALSTQTQETI